MCKKIGEAGVKTEEDLRLQSKDELVTRRDGKRSYSFYLLFKCL